MNPCEKLIAYLQELLDSHRKLAALLGEKIKAVNAYDIQAMEAILKEEQAYSLLSRGFESTLKGYLERLGLEGSTLSEAAAGLPEEYRSKALALAGDLKAVAETVKTLNEQCRRLLEAELHALDKSIRELDRSNPGLYGRAAAAFREQGSRVLTKSI